MGILIPYDIDFKFINSLWPSDIIWRHRSGRHRSGSVLTHRQ